MFSGHVHPKITTINEMGCLESKTCWIILPTVQEELSKKTECRANTVVIFPPFNPLIPGLNIISRPVSVGPFFRNNCLNKSKAEILLEDGTYIGLHPLK